MFNVRITVQDCQVEVCATGRSLVQRSPTMRVCVCVCMCVIVCDRVRQLPQHPQRLDRRVKTKKEIKEGWG